MIAFRKHFFVVFKDLCHNHEVNRCGCEETGCKENMNPEKLKVIKHCKAWQSEQDSRTKSKQPFVILFTNNRCKSLVIDSHIEEYRGVAKIAADHYEEARIYRFHVKQSRNYRGF